MPTLPGEGPFGDINRGEPYAVQATNGYREVIPRPFAVSAARRAELEIAWLTAVDNEAHILGWQHLGDITGTFYYLRRGLWFLTDTERANYDDSSVDTLQDAMLAAAKKRQKQSETQRVEKHFANQGQAAAPVDGGSAMQRKAIARDVKMFVWQRDGGVCVYCGDNRDLEFDHIIPVSMGGANTARNLQLLCESCNRSKGGNL